MMGNRRSDLIVRLPQRLNRWIGIDELKKVQVDVVDPARRKKVGTVPLDTLLRKMR